MQSDIYYEDLLAAFEMRSALDRETALEDDYQQHVCAIVARLQPSMLVDYCEPWAFCGGGAAWNPVFSRLLKQLGHFGAQDDCSDIFCGMWPRGDLGAETRYGGTCAVILFNMGLWFQLRYACQQVAASIASISGDFRVWGADKDPLAFRLFGESLDSYISGDRDLRQNTRLFVMRGVREDFRRSLNLAAISFVLAHEYYHARDRKSSASLAWSENGEISSQWIEREADIFALRFVADHHAGLAIAYGPLLVLTMQGYALRKDQVLGRDPLNWTHIAPELRTEFVINFLDSKAPGLGEVARAFKNWMWDTLDYKKVFATGTGRST